MDRLTNAEGEVRIAIVGKYTQLEDAYKSISEALTHGGIAHNVKVRLDWVDSEVFERGADGGERRQKSDGESPSHVSHPSGIEIVVSAAGEGPCACAARLP